MLDCFMSTTLPEDDIAPPCASDPFLAIIWLFSILVSCIVKESPLIPLTYNAPPYTKLSAVIEL